MSGQGSMPFAEYVNLDAVNGSSLFVALKSWLHYRDALDNPRPQSAPMALGTATHVSVLEPDEFPRRYFVATEDQIADLAPPRNEKAGKDGWRDYCRRHPEQGPVKSDEYQRLVVAEVFNGKEMLSEANYARCIAMRNAVRSHPIAGPLLNMGRAEQVIQWTEHVPHGLGTVAVRCKGRIDWRRAPAVFVDLKTTRATSAHQFAGQQWGLSTFHKMAFYRRGIAAEIGCSREAVTPYVISVESTPPHSGVASIATRRHAVTAFEVYPGDAESAGLANCDDEIDRLLRELVACRESGKWPGPHDDKIESMRPPAYAFGGAGQVEFLDTDPADDVPLELEG